MSKSDQNAAKSQAQNQINTNNQNESTTSGQLNSILGTATGNANNLFPGITGNYSDISGTGGYDPNMLNTINTTGTNLATTGGISGADATSMQNRAAEAAKSTYMTGQADASRASAATGGYGVTGGAIDTALARKGSQAASTAVEDTNASIAGLRQQGEVAGAGILGQTQQNLTGNKLAATAGLTNVYGMNENQINQTVGQILQNYQQTGQLNNQDLTILTNLANQPGVFDKIVGTIGTLGGAAAGIMTGIGGNKGVCWIAEAIYGENDLRTHLLRKYLNTEFAQTWPGNAIMFVYRAIGKQVSWFVRRSNVLQNLFRPMFDSVLYGSK